MDSLAAWGTENLSLSGDDFIAITTTWAVSGCSCPQVWRIAVIFSRIWPRHRLPNSPRHLPVPNNGHLRHVCACILLFRVDWSEEFVHEKGKS